MSDPTIPIRGRLQAAENLLAYKTPQDVAESAKLFLASIFTDPEQNIDHRLAATTALRRSEDVRIVPPIERPPPPVRTDNSEEPQIPLAELVAQRRARADQMEIEMAETIKRDLREAQARSQARQANRFIRNGNGSDESSEG